MMMNHDMLLRLAIELEQDNRHHSATAHAPARESRDNGKSLIQPLARAYHSIAALLA
jgi:hypothetical protein